MPSLNGQSTMMTSPRFISARSSSVVDVHLGIIPAGAFSRLAEERLLLALGERPVLEETCKRSYTSARRRM